MFFSETYDSLMVRALLSTSKRIFMFIHDDSDHERYLISGVATYTVRFEHPEKKNLITTIIHIFF